MLDCIDELKLLNYMKGHARIRGSSNSFHFIKLVPEKASKGGGMLVSESSGSISSNQFHLHVTWS